MIVRPQKRGATVRPHQSLDSAALWWLLASDSIWRSLAEPGTRLMRMRLSPGVLTWGKGHFLQNKLEGDPRKNLGDWAVQSGKYGKALGLDTRALAGLSEAIYKGSVSSVFLLKGQATLSSFASACHVLVLTHRTQCCNFAQVPWLVLERPPVPCPSRTVAKLGCPVTWSRCHR